MRIGLLARADDRGLGNQTWEVYRHLHPEKVLVARLPGSERQGFPVHLDRFPGATVIKVDERRWEVPEAEVRAWLDGLDVVYTAETLYDPRIAEWARDQHVATVIHANPEWYRADVVHPTAWWSATNWRSEHLPADLTVVPMPVPTDRWPNPNPGTSVLHVTGKAAAHDRNGSNDARRLVDAVTDQDRRPKPNYWELYEGHGILLLPRRYGGLCLPVIEGCGAGLVPVMPDVAPNNTAGWPIVPIPATRTGSFTMMGGDIDLYDCVQADIAAAVQCARDNLDACRAKVREFVANNSWDALTDTWVDELERAADRRPTKPTPTSPIASPPAEPTVSVLVPFTPGRCPHRDVAWAHIQHRYATVHPEWEIVTGTCTGSTWCKAEAIADARTRARGSVFVVADADVWVEDLDRAITEAVARGWSMPHKRNRRLSAEATRLVLGGGPLEGELDERENDAIVGGGILVLTRDAFDQVPMDPRFVGWGGEDHAWGLALKAILGKGWRGEAQLWHLWHPPQERLNRTIGSHANDRLRRRYYRARQIPDEIRTILQEAADALARTR